MKESYELNSRGLEIFSKSWLPETSPPKALICFCHGYGDTCTFFVEGIARKLASSGYGVFAMDYAGFGLSEGLHGYIPSFNKLVDDVIEHYSKIKESVKQILAKGNPHFVCGARVLVKPYKEKSRLSESTQGLNLPDSLFASPMTSRISTAT
ncbi:hypothetical protein POM88_051353 [Heracleum sosnowskyi]|uniref:Serine aminopeptidase S33 domain-containing protein n=1 Tax=Heracleum sosnowskyi TaxID=360622 RepID=A0AAD8GUM2_9APIA|nr:hypothetical protein POM88_048898 [Heracleum sosnowskyi]KAK1358097.1 hypothetical protein POM88_051353 [Heracleum sosnowskyi]